MPDLQISVPKRLVRAAVRRNTVKRVLREAWRAACVASFPTAGRVWRFQLKAHPAGGLVAKSQYARAQMRMAARRAAGRAASMPVGMSARQPVEFIDLSSSGFAASKRQLRAEADALLAEARARLQTAGLRRAPGGVRR
ncbi:MAG: ribonuclease P protein component [Lautropia sp.]|nr:ribonuclease P protein component [Lautropia sp.]